MRFSLAVPTIGRVVELDRLLRSLAEQTVDDFEVLLIDQNEDDRIVPVAESYRGTIDLERIRTDRRGASAARNEGFRRSRGEIVTFPDDDCWYPRDLLGEVDSFLRDHPSVDALSVQSRDGEGVSSVVDWAAAEGRVTRIGELRRSVEFGVFFRRGLLEDVGGFDEELGPGAGTPWGAHEGSDLNARALDRGYVIHYRPDLFVYHPDPTRRMTTETAERGRSYGRGMGRVFRRHDYPLWYVSYMLSRSLAGLALSLVRLDFASARYYAACLSGRLQGWLDPEGSLLY